MKNRARIEMMAIYITAALLLVSVGGLAGRVAAAKAGSTDKYPSLHAPAMECDAANPEKIIYFTFDDGPSGNTEKILDVLMEERAKATFFVTMQLEDTDEAIRIMRRIVDEGHTLALHSYTHNFDKIYKNADAYLTDINKLNDFIIENIEYRPSILRFPGGSRSSHCARKTMDAIIDEITSRGYTYYDWDIVSGDDGRLYPASHLAQTMLRGITDDKSAVILAHDGASQKTTAEAVRMVIEELRPRGYSFDSLSPGVGPVHLK